MPAKVDATMMILVCMDICVGMAIVQLNLKHKIAQIAVMRLQQNLWLVIPLIHASKTKDIVILMMTAMELFVVAKTIVQQVPDMPMEQTAVMTIVQSGLILARVH